MHRTKVESSNVESIGYDRHAKILEIEYKSGGIYQYPETKAAEYADLMAAESKGRYIKNHFVTEARPYTRMEEENADKDAD